MKKSPMKHSPACPCGTPKCQQLIQIHQQINEHYNTLRKIAHSTTQDELLADDLLQVFCVNIIARPHNFTPKTSFVALGRVSIKRLYLNTLRNKKILTPANSHDSVKLSRLIERGGLVERASSHDTYQDVELQDLFQAMCDTLSNSDERQVLMMLYEGHSGREIAEQLKMNVNTVHGMIRRVRHRLLDEFDEVGAS
jgi:RNA polymerase sigma factor (sigma-70 family)